MAEFGSVREHAKALLNEIAERDVLLQCYVAIDRAAVLRDAARLDALPHDRRGPLHGRTLAVKDIIDVAGLPTRAGSSFFRRDPAHDAPVVARLRAAGALVIGKTNTHEFAWGITTENPHFGTTANPRNPSRTAGGSSGGSGAAVAAGLADLALGTDTLGSVRIPAAVCGICGIRPATGTLSVEGIVPLALGLDTPGPFAPDVAGVHAAYEALTGSAVPRSAVPPSIARLRGGGWEAVSPAVQRAFDALAQRLGARGIRVVDVDWWDDDLIAAIAVMQMYAAARVHAPLIAEHRDGYGADVRGRVERALQVSETDEARARETVAAAHASWIAALGSYACALAPTVGDEAPTVPVRSSFREETIPLVTPASAFGLPALAVPIGAGDHGLPLGAQIVAAAGDVGDLFAAGAEIEALFATV